MKRIRSALASIAGAIAGVLDAFRPEPGTTEGAVYLGLTLVAAAFLVDGHPDWALGVPGGVLTFLGAAPTIAKLRRKG